GIGCHLITASSGKLTAQITEGAPYDIFIAADMKYPRELYNSGLALAPPVSCGYGQLVLWTTTEGLSPSIPLLQQGTITHIALANPQTAPYGRAAMEVLNHYGLYEDLSHKLVYGESISQTNQFITSRSAELGFTAMAVVLSPGLSGQGSWSVIDKKAYSPIEHGAVIINRDQGNSDDIQAFYEYLFSGEAKMLLKNFGYLVDE
ncbi:MAG: molybdate ABC transporter substrate-binding protein, partial [Eudoraea sp.]|nr:molybdate ABC transporter substrate-binding protein [Eudoraea sp.]